MPLTPFSGLSSLSVELAYVEFTSGLLVTATTAGAAQDVVSSGTVAYDGSAVVIEFYAPVIEPGSSGGIMLLLQDGASILGQFAYVQPGSAVINDQQVTPIRRLVPTPGNHTYKVTAYRATANGNIYSGVGGSGNYLPGFIRVSRVETQVNVPIPISVPNPMGLIVAMS